MPLTSSADGSVTDVENIRWVRFDTEAGQDSYALLNAVGVTFCSGSDCARLLACRMKKAMKFVMSMREEFADEPGVFEEFLSALQAFQQALPFILLSLLNRACGVLNRSPSLPWLRPVLFDVPDAGEDNRSLVGRESARHD